MPLAENIKPKTTLIERNEKRIVSGLKFEVVGEIFGIQQVRIYREFAVRGRGCAGVLFENSRKIRYAVETEFVGNFAERHGVLFDEFQRLVDFKFYYIVDYGFVIGSSERSAYVRNAVIQVFRNFLKRRVFLIIFF